MCAALFGLPSCSDDGDVTQEGTDAPVDTVPTVVEDPDSMVGQQSIDGRLADAAVVVDPTSGMTYVVTVPDVALAGGVPAGPGRVVYGTDQDLVLVDTTARTVTDLGLPTTQYSVALAAATGGVGRQWAALVDAARHRRLHAGVDSSDRPVGALRAAPGPRASVVAVDTEDGSVVTLDALRTNEQITSWAAFSPVGPWALVATDAPEQDDQPVTRGRLVNLDTGEVVDLGTGFQGGTFSPDGRQVAWSSGDAAELRIAPVDDLATAEVVTTGVAVPVWLAA